MATETQLVGSTADLFGQAEARSGQGRKINQELGKDAFLQLLVAQLKNQDPMKPMEDTAFIGEMAQFTSLEQMQNLNKLMEAQASFGALTQATNLIGKHVVVLDQATGGQMTGVVDEVRMIEGKAQLIVGGKPYAHTEVLQVSTVPFTSGTPTPPAANSGTAAEGTTPPASGTPAPESGSGTGDTSNNAAG